MKLKKWLKARPAWLRGGIIGATVAIIGSFSPYVFGALANLNILTPITNFFALIGFFLSIPFNIIGFNIAISDIFGCSNFEFIPCTFDLIVGNVITIILFFIFGGYLSWMKSKGKLRLGILTIILLLILVWLSLHFLVPPRSLSGFKL